MLLKSKIFSGFMIIIALYCIVSFSVLAIDDNTTSGSSVQNASEYINVIKEDVYYQEMIVSVINQATFYNIGETYRNIYDIITVDDALKGMKYYNYGFQCNGSFYDSCIEITKSGTYSFQVVFFTYDNDGLKIPTESVIESFTITVDLEVCLELSESVYFYEHTYTVDAFIENIYTNFNYEIIIENISDFEEAYQMYLNYVKIDVESYYCDDLNREIIAVIDFLGIEYNFSIQLSSVLNPIYSDNYIVDKDSITNSVPNLAFDVFANSSNWNNKKISETNIYNYLEIDEYLISSIGQKYIVEIDNSSVLTIVPDLETVGQYTYKNIIYTITDISTGNIYTHVRLIMFYNSNYLAKYCSLNIEVFDELIFEKNEIIEVDKIVKSAQSIVTLYGIEYYNPLNISSVSLKTAIDSSTLGKQNVIIEAITADNTATTYSFYIEVRDLQSPIILTQYNYIIIEKGNINYVNQILIIDDDQVDATKTVYYELEETNENGGYITIYAEDISGNSTIETFSFVYYNYPSNIYISLKNFLYSYGNFLRKIF